ncbi:MAG: L-ribulose-5-phosphate 3-epimerase, partial [Candidatus Paceibacteria bacterium]
MFTLGYNTNGLAHHRLVDALPMLAKMGYGAVALTPDVGQLDPFNSTAAEVAHIARLAAELKLSLVVETGARFLMDARRKHFPTLLETDAKDRARRLDFLRRSVDLAQDLGSPLVSIWAGATPDGSVVGSKASSAEAHWERLCQGVEALLQHARGSGVSIAFEPEPGMFVERPREYRELLERLGSAGAELGMTLDVGHLVATDDLPVERVIAEFSAQTINVHLDDCPLGVHRHGPFGS